MFLFFVGFYNVVGGYVIAGIHGLPLILYTYQHQEQIPYELNYIFAAGVVILIPARVLGSLVEVRQSVTKHSLHKTKH